MNADETRALVWSPQAQTTRTPVAADDCHRQDGGSQQEEWMKMGKACAANQAIWEEFHARISIFIQKRVRNAHDAEDILQDVFYRIYKNIDGLRESENVHAWVYRIAKNSIIDFYRTQRREEDISELYEAIASETDAEPTADGEVAQCLGAMIMYLPESYKQALIMTEFQNLTQKELGKEVGPSVSGAKSRVQRARAKLKEMLVGCCQFEFDRIGNIIDYKHKCSDRKFC